jgi:integral membrane sensor domain MASE1
VWIFAGAFLANSESSGLAAAAVIAAGNTLEACITGWLLRKWSNGARTFDSPWGVARVAGLCLATGTIVGATIGVGTLLLGGAVNPAAFTSIWTTWWLGDVGGQLLVAPAILLWLRPRTRPGLANSSAPLRFMPLQS